MTSVELSIAISLSEAEAGRLNEAFRNAPSEGQSQVEAATPLVEALAAAGFREYLLYVTGERVPAGVRELRELRLWLLARCLPDHLPSDTTIASLFRLTSAQARNLVAGTRARYPEEFVGFLEAAACAALREAEEIEGVGHRITASQSLAAFLRDLLAEASVPPPLKRPETSKRYDLPPETVAELCQRLGISESQVGSAA